MPLDHRLPPEAEGLIRLAVRVEPAPMPRCRALAKRLLEQFGSKEPSARRQGVGHRTLLMWLPEALLGRLGASEADVALAERILVELPRLNFRDEVMARFEGALRQTALQAADRMGEKRLQQLFGHPVAKSKYRDGLYYLRAIRGENAADVEAGFVKRDKLAVQALGLLPDEGDLFNRFLALQRFARESKQFGALRRASEAKAVEQGMANLAVTAGYSDVGELTWAMEAQLAQSADPAATRWQVGEYMVSIEPDAKATLAVERRAGEEQAVDRFAGRTVRIGALVQRLKRYGWHIGANGELERRLPSKASAALWLKDGAAYFAALEILTVGELELFGPIPPVIFSEVLREVDLAIGASAADLEGV